MSEKVSGKYKGPPLLEKPVQRARGGEGLWVVGCACPIEAQTTMRGLEANGILHLESEGSCTHFDDGYSSWQ